MVGIISVYIDTIFFCLFACLIGWLREGMLFLFFIVFVLFLFLFVWLVGFVWFGFCLTT